MTNINHRFFRQLNKQVYRHLYYHLDDLISGQIDSQFKRDLYDRLYVCLDIRIWDQLSDPLKLHLRTQLIKQIGL